MKKLAAVLICTMLLCSLAACGKKPAEETETPEVTMPTMAWGASEVVLPEDYFD